jgi:hypothetical protein
MEKNLSIIQGLTDTDQANPIRITDAGEVKTTTTLNGGNVTVEGTVSIDTNEIVIDDKLIDPNQPYINAVAGINKDKNTYNYLRLVDSIDRGQYASGSVIAVDSPKLLVEQGKQFELVYVNTVDASGFNEADITNAITTFITEFINNYGPRYDDLKITFLENVANSQTYSYLNIVITRYFS